MMKTVGLRWKILQTSIQLLFFYFSIKQMNSQAPLLFRQPLKANSCLLHLIILLLIAQRVQLETIYLQKFPVNRILSFQTEARLNRLRDSLKSMSPQTDKQELYLRAKLCEIYLQELARQSMIDYNNVMQGEKNLVDGVNNIVMGSKNKVNGKNNWIFSTNYDQTSDRVLVIDQWKIQLDKIEQIRINPSTAITKW